MKGKIVQLLFLCVFTYNINAQTASSLLVNDSRAVNDLPDFSSTSIRADFKQRGAIGVPGDGFFSANITISPWSSADNTGGKNHQLNFNDGGIFYRNAFPKDTKWGGWRKLLMIEENGSTETGNLILKNYENYNGKGNIITFTSYGSELYGPQIRSYLTYADGINSRTGLVLSSYSKGFMDEVFLIDGLVGVGTKNPKNKLDVNGTIRSKEVKVELQGWSDFVFKKEYNLPTLEEVEKHIAEKGHLENIPSEEEVLKNGIDLGEMNAKLLQKIEELTLYMIEMKKENVEMKERLTILEKK
ncbi:hypothetical protein [Flavobacterium branchiicola]|uniref:Cell wall anchor protein n=1 Tax=Flavobacterium branchiicola TaxID=1114875 RepID=A0ABV9PEB5_9FLAO|nr:hypothetical protein [Flavobacterium branchiicola]